MLQFLRRMISKESAVGSVVSNMQLGKAVFPTRNFETYAKEAYQRNIIAYRCIELISTSAASVPWLIYKGDDEMTEHPVLELLSDPNPNQTGKELFTSIFAYDLIAGNSYIERVMVDNGKQPQELYSLRPDRMRVIAGKLGMPAAYEYAINHQRAVRFDVNPIDGRSDVLHVKRFHPTDDWYGQSPLDAMGMSVDSHNEATKWNYALLQNSARPSGALRYTGTDELSDNDYTRLKQELEQGYSGAKRGRPMLLQGGLEWVEMMLTQKDMEWNVGRMANATEIAIGYKVPEQLVGVPGQQTYNNYREARMALYEDAVLPLLDKYCEALTNWFDGLPGFEGIRIGYDEDKIPALALRREALWDRVNTAQHLTIDEKREALGYEPYQPDDKAPGGKLLVPAGLIPLDDLSMAFTDEGGNDGEAEESDNDVRADGNTNDQPTESDTADSAGGGSGGNDADSGGDADVEGNALNAEQGQGTPVQALALNGAQVSALVAIVQAVVNEELPEEAAVQIITVAFPTVTPATARALISPAADFDKPVKPNPITGQMPPTAPKPDDESEDDEKARLYKHAYATLNAQVDRMTRDDLAKAHALAYGGGKRR